MEKRERLWEEASVLTNLLIISHDRTGFAVIF